ncbi:MAG: tyrosine-type recombinase/integrase [Betaproteobacteria bacterium]
MATWAERQKVPEKGQADYAPDDTGLKLRVFASGRRCWYIRGRMRRAAIAGEPRGEGESRFVVLGEVPGMSRDDADAAAANARDMLRRGLDPMAERDAAVRKAQASTKKFAEVVAEWTAESKGGWRPSTIAVYRAVFNGPRLAAIRERRIAGITAADLKAIKRGITVNSQQAALGPVRSVFRFAVKQGYIPKSPFDGEKDLKIEKAEGDAAPLVEFHEGRAPNFAELVATLDAMAAAEQSRPLSPWWNIWRVCILTGQRPSAVIGMRWSELALDGDAPSWTIPIERSKVKREAKIPLAKDCAALLRDLPRKAELVWPGRDGKSELSYPPAEPQILSALLADRGFAKGWWAGRARDSVASWLEFQSDATERAMALLLNHKPPAENTRRKHYAKIGAEHQARVLIERWAQAVREARAGKAARVVPLRKGA